MGKKQKRDGSHISTNSQVVVEETVGMWARGSCLGGLLGPQKSFTWSLIQGNKGDVVGRGRSAVSAVNCKDSLLRVLKHKTSPWFSECLLANIWAPAEYPRVSGALCLYLLVPTSSLGACYCLWWNSLLGPGLLTKCSSLDLLSGASVPSSAEAVPP